MSSILVRLYARAYGTPQEQASSRRINQAIVIGHSKSPDDALRLTAIDNLVDRMQSGKIPAATVLDLLTHPVRRVSAVAFDTILVKGMIVPGLYNEAFVSSLLKFPRDEWTVKLSHKGFPQDLLILILKRPSDYDVSFSCCASQALVRRVMDKTFEPRLLMRLGEADVINLLRYPGFGTDARIAILEGAIPVRVVTRTGWHFEGCDDNAQAVKNEHPQKIYSLPEPEEAANLLEAAFAATHPDEKRALTDKLFGSEKLGRFLIQKGDPWANEIQFLTEPVKIGADQRSSKAGKVVIEDTTI